MLKYILYGVMVSCFVVAGVLDALDKQWKQAILAILFGMCNALIFFWRTGGK
jgi:hypothetical protein